MKKWLIGCLTVLAMVCLIPGIVLKAAAETVPVFCARCETMNKREVLRYEKDDSTCHRVYVTECPNCHNDGDIAYIMFHTGGTQTPTCTTGKICEKCGEEYGILGHDWGAWTSAGNGTHTRSCTRSICREFERANCTGGTATCSAKAVCVECGGEYGEKDPKNHDRVHHNEQAPTCTEIGWDAFDTCSRCKDSYTADPTDQLGHQFGAWSPNGTGSQSAGCLRQGCAHIGSTDCRKFTFRTAEGKTLTFCPVCGQAENAAQLEKLEAATAWAASGSLSAEDVTARTNGEYLSVAFETAGSLTQPTGRVRLALPAGLLEGKKLVRIAPDGTQTEMPFEAKNGRLIFTLDFADSELPVMFFRLVPQTTVL